MKKIGLILFAACASMAATAQNVVDIYSTGASGSFTSGNCTSTARVDNTIAVQNLPTPKRGYAVFNLNTLPATAAVSNVELHFNKESVVGPGGGAYTTRGYLGDLSLVTVPATLYATMGIAPSIYTASYGGAAGNTFLPNDPLAATFVDTNIGRKVSIIWTTTTARTYAITGETGAATTAGTHAPFLRITYNCPSITSITAGGPSVTPCPNTAFALSGSATGGIASYSWAGPFGYSSTLTSPTVSAGLPSSGVYTFTVTDTSGCSIKATTLVTVLAAPISTVTASTLTAFCDGDSATLDVPTSVGGSYQWYNGTVAITGATNSTYVSYASGSYKVQVTDASGCTSTSAVSTPTIMLSNPAVSPAGPILLCAGDNGTLTVNTNGVTTGMTFQWQKDGVDLSGAVGQSNVATVSGIYRCIVSVTASTCVDTSMPVTVVVNSYPTPVITFSGSMLHTAATYATYQWFLNTIAIAGATSSSYVPTVGGSYRIRVTDANSCTAFSSGYLVNTVGVNMLNGNSVRLYPNPVLDILRIESPFVVNAVLNTIEGKEIGNYENASAINMHNLPIGLYILTIYNEAGERVKVEKIVKQ